MWDPLLGRHPLRRSRSAWMLITFATFWIALLLHEAAHFGVAQLMYSPIELSSGYLPPRDDLLVVGAGPTVTLAMIVACAAATRQLRRARAVGIAAIAFGVSRILMIGPTALLNTGMNDERTVAQLLGVPAGVVWIVEALIATAAVSFVALTTPLAQPHRSVMAIAAAIVLGWLSAFTVGRAFGLPI